MQDNLLDRFVHFDRKNTIHNKKNTHSGIGILSNVFILPHIWVTTSIKIPSKGILKLRCIVGKKFVELMLNPSVVVGYIY